MLCLSSWKCSTCWNLIYSNRCTSCYGNNVNGYSSYFIFNFHWFLDQAYGRGTIWDEVFSSHPSEMDLKLTTFLYICYLCRFLLTVIFDRESANAASILRSSSFLRPSSSSAYCNLFKSVFAFAHGCSDRDYFSLCATMTSDTVAPETSPKLETPSGRGPIICLLWKSLFCTVKIKSPHSQLQNMQLRTEDIFTLCTKNYSISGSC